MTTGVEFKVVGMAIKTLFLPLIAWFFIPIYDFIILQVTDYSLLLPIEKAILNDAKIILGVLILIFTLVKLILGSIKIKKEISSVKTKPE